MQISSPSQASREASEKTMMSTRAEAGKNYTCAYTQFLIFVLFENASQGHFVPWLCSPQLTELLCAFGLSPIHLITHE